MFAKRKSGKILKVFCLIFSLLLMAAVTGSAENVQASETEMPEDAISSHRDSIVRVESICWDGDSVIYRTKSFSGFVVVSDTSGIYVATVQKNLQFSAEEKEVIENEYKEKLKAEEAAKVQESEDDQNQYKAEPTVRIADKIEVILSGDVRVKASIIGESEQRNLTVLKLEQAINLKNTFEFPQEGTESKETGTAIFLLGYPNQEGTSVYNSEMVEMTEGVISGSYEQDEISFFSHDIQADAGCIGGPLLYEDGLLAGVYLTAAGETEGTAISSESLKAFLETFKISGKEHQEAKKEKKTSPVLNILLGVVILILLFMVVTKRNGRNNIQKKVPDSNPKEQKSKKKQSVIQRKSHGAKNMTNLKASLEYLSEKRLVLINKPLFMIGRTSEMDFILPENRGISRKHACIEFETQEFYLSDLNSTNHTFLNGQQLIPGKKYKLKSGDEIMIGKEPMMFYRE
ncbi:MAG: FHA domain-containing protein [Eubacteriales bacterium]|nr:FHA domain-containing protein [Eubacteriales bacterium]